MIGHRLFVNLDDVSRRDADTFRAIVTPEEDSRTKELRHRGAAPSPTQARRPLL